MWSHKGTEITTLRGHRASIAGCAIAVVVKEDKTGNVDGIAPFCTDS